MKVKKYIILLLCTVILTTGCSTQNKVNNEDKNQNQTQQSNYNKDYKLTYTNLIDDKTKEEIVIKLKDSGVKEDSINYFIEKVNSYNKIMKEMKGLQSGYITTELPEASFDDVYSSQKWEKEGYLYQDFNCRLTAFEMMKDFINSGSQYTGDSSNLFMDLDSIDNYPLSKFNKEDKDKFINLFAAIKAEDTKDYQVHVDTIKKELEKRNISFNTNGKISMINGYLHDYDTKELFVGHSGVLIEDKEGLTFVEKYSFLTPYIVSKFNTRKELYSYLMNRLDVDTTGNGSKPIIMENDNVMLF